MLEILGGDSICREDQTVWHKVGKQHVSPN